MTVSRPLRHLVISTRRVWFWRNVRRIRFDQVSRIVYRAQAIPSLSVWRYLSLGSSDTSDSALSLISLALKDTVEEVYLFTVWEQQPDGGDWLDGAAGDDDRSQDIGDEAAGSVVELLHEYLGVPIRSH